MQMTLRLNGLSMIATDRPFLVPVLWETITAVSKRTLIEAEREAWKAGT